MSQYSDVSVIGLGAIGWGAAQSLQRSGYTVYGADIRSDVLERFADEKGKPCQTPAEAAAASPVVIIFVVNEIQIEEVLFGENGAVSAAEPGTLFINSTTMPPSSAARIGERLESAGMRVVDAPVAGGAARAKRGELMVLISGSADALKFADPVIDAIAGRVYRIGTTVGQASQIKMINQLLSGVHLAATAEAMTLAKKVGADLDTVYDVITHTTGNSWMFEDRGSHIVNGDYAPRSPISIIAKDLRIVETEADAVGSDVPLTRAALGMFFEAIENGFGKEDGSALAKLLGRKAGILMPGVNPD